MVLNKTRRVFVCTKREQNSEHRINIKQQPVTPTVTEQVGVYICSLIFMIPSKKRVKSFPSLTAHRAALISIPLALNQTPAYTAKTADTGPVHRTVCPFTPRQLGRYQIILLGDRGTWV